MKVVIGLGNPEEKYSFTRHNIGFLVIDALVGLLGLDVAAFKGKDNYVYWQGQSQGEKILLVKPLTYMNLSGEAAIKIKRFYQCEVSDFLFLVDDYYLPFGQLKLRRSGSPGGHNGLKSIQQYFGQDYDRVRCGIANAEILKPMVQFVLDDFTREEKKELDAYTDFVAKAVKMILEKGIEPAMNSYNNKKYKGG